ncbi:Uncharacterised protein [uncultured archaeon]|nr:Uncharacterised protein [uncultured archaeon]
MVILIMRKEKHNVHPNIDWDALDKSWADQYEDDYGYRFSNMHFNNIKTYIHTSSQFEEGAVSSV